MQVTKDDLESLKQDIGEDVFEQKIEGVNILFLDISSTCTGYAIANVDFLKKAAEIKKAGCVWLNPEWSHQEKYAYMVAAVRDYFWIVEAIDYIVVEQYSVNPKKLMGVNVVSEMQGAIKAAAEENGVKVASILPQTWRSVLKIKMIKTADGKRDYKTPTKDYITAEVAVPEQVKSNITGKDRKTPSDVYDAMAIAKAWLVKFGMKTVKFNSEIQYNSHIAVLPKEKI